MTEDPIAAAFDQHRRAPRDVVPRTVNHAVGDVRRLADGAQQVLVTHYETTEHGVTKHTEWATITQPIINNNRKENR
jgi:hypothetical protein